MKTLLIKCSCKHEYQDKLYGNYIRVGNQSGKDPTKIKCTVCGNITSRGIETTS